MSQQAIFRQCGSAIDYSIAPGDPAVSAGQVVEIGTIPLVATRDIAAGDLGALNTEGVFNIVKKVGAISAGDACYWDTDGSPVGGVALSGAVSTTAADGNLIGYATADAASGDERVQVKLSASKRTTSIGGSITADDITGSDATLTISGLQAAAGGTITVSAGTSTTGGNAGGLLTLQGGTPGATGVGGGVTVSGRAGGSASGAGGEVIVKGGDGTAGNANGGALTLRGGDANGAGTDGVLNAGATNTSQVNLAAASIPTAIVGPLNRTPGASTAAAGTTTADATVLPAGTAGVYPTTAADDTKGVRMHANDKVTGRQVLIGNGVSNKILKVYPASGGTINGAAADAAFSGASGKGVIMYCLDSAANTWLAW